MDAIHSPVALAFMAFLTGAIFDVLNVGFLHYSEHGRPLPAAIFSVLVGGISLTGIWTVFHSFIAIPFLLIGYFVGTYVAVKVKSRKTPT